MIAAHPGARRARAHAARARLLPALLGAVLAASACSVVNDPEKLEPGPDATVPPAPQGLAAIPGTTSVALRWDAVQVADLERYVVLVGTAPGELAAAGETADPSFVVTGLAAGTYWFSAVAVDEAGNVSDLAAEVAAGPDRTPPSVGFDPEDGASTVEVRSELVLAFSEPMDRASVEAALAVTRLDAGEVPARTCRWEAGDRVAVCGFAAELAPSATYAASVGAGARDVAGNALAPARATFTTAAGPDATPPAVASTIPAGGAEGVAPEGDVSVTFSEAMGEAAAGAFGIAAVDGSAEAAAPYRSGRLAFTGGGRTLTYDPPASFPEGAVVTYTVGTGACDRAGRCLAAPFTGSFRVARRTTVSLEADPALGGYARRGAEDAVTVWADEGSLFAGDDASDRAYRAWLSFSHAALTPAPTRIVSATLRVHQAGCVGAPHGALDAPRIPVPGSTCREPPLDCDRDLLARHVDAGASLGPDDFSTAALASASVELTGSPAEGWVSRPVGPQVEADRGAGRDRTQLRLEFPEATNADGIADYCMLHGAGAVPELRPTLEVTFEHW